MAKIGLFYGSTRKTEATEALGGDIVIPIHEISDVTNSDFAKRDRMIIAYPTWDIDALQSDWEGFCEDDSDSIDLGGNKRAYFGAGNQVSYADNFQDEMEILIAKRSSVGGETVSYWFIKDYEHEASKADRGGKFIGLALDEDNRLELTGERIQESTTLLETEFALR